MCFIQILPALHQPNAQGQNVDARTHAAFVLVHTLVHCAAIQLHIGHAGHNAAAMARCFAAAKTVAGLAQHFDVASIKCVNPITAVRIPSQHLFLSDRYALLVPSMSHYALARTGLWTHVTDPRPLPPCVLQVLWASAADALVQCLRALNNFDRSGTGASLSFMPTKETIIEALNKLTASIAAFGQVSPLFGS